MGAKGNILIGLQHLLHTSCLVFSSKGEIYVADAGNGRVVRLSPEGKYLSEWGRKGKGESEFAAAHAIAIDGRDRIYVADRGNNRVQVFSPAGKFLAAWTGFGNPFGVLVVGKELLVGDGDAHTISDLRLSDGSLASGSVGRPGDVTVAASDGCRREQEPFRRRGQRQAYSEVPPDALR